MSLSLAIFAVDTRLVSMIVAIGLLGLGAGAARPLTQDGLSVLQPAVRGRVTLRMEQLTGVVNTVVLVAGGVGLQGGHTGAVMWGSAVAVALTGLVILAARPGSRRIAEAPA